MQTTNLIDNLIWEAMYGKNKKGIMSNAIKKIRQESTQLIKKFQELEQSQRSNHKEYEAMLSKKGVYLVHPAAFRRYENCANFLRSLKILNGG